MLDPRFKNIHIMEKDVSFVEEYDKKCLYPMLVKCHEHLHYLMRLVKNYANQDIFY
jgi:hypothetical protein